MDLRSLIGAALASGLAASATFAACSGSTPAPPAHAPPASTPPAPARAPVAADAGAAAAPDEAAAARRCDDPPVEILNHPDGGVIFNNAMTSADAGHIDRGATILAALDEQSQAIRCCLRAWLRDHPDAPAELMLQIVLQPDGGLADAGVDPRRSSIDDAFTARCLAAALADARFPESPRNSETVVEYPIRARTRSE